MAKNTLIKSITDEFVDEVLTKVHKRSKYFINNFLDESINNKNE